ncbi:MAG: choice-of-anchor D domain-containing protein [Candidatus Sulfotelmatobacter sp.]
MRAKLTVIFACLFAAVYSFGQTGNMKTFSGLNTVQYRLNATAAPDVTVAVGQTEYCEHVNNAYQCWYKSGANANQPVNFLGSTNPKSDNGPWSQNSNNSGNTPNCPAAYTPNSQLLHDNVYSVWILEKRITSPANGHNYMCVAISNMDDVSQSSFGWFAFEFDLSTVLPTNSHGNYYYPDYPQVGLWQSSTSTVPPYTAATDQAMWISYDLEDPNASSNINGVLLCAVDLAGLRASTSNPWVNNSKTPACAVAHTLTPFNQRRSWVPANNSDTTPPISADGEMFTYMIEPPKDGKSYLTDPNHTQGVEQWTINWSSSTPTPTLVNSWDLASTMPGGDQLGCFVASSYYNTVCIPQPSTSATGIHLDSVADRMQQFFHYTSNGGQGSIWTAVHDIQISPSASSRSQTEADIRVLQRNTSAANSVFVAGDYPIVDPSDGSAYVFLPSVVRDKAGNLQGILGISGSGTNEHPGLDSLYFNPGTLASSTYGSIASPITDGDAEDTGNLNYRWGDWHSAVLDPSDSCTVWVAGEYLQSNRTTEPYWYTELASLPPVSTCAAGPVLLSNVSLNFGGQAVDVEDTPIVETITNNQSVALNISGIMTTTGDFTQTNTCQQAIAPHGTCTVTVYFTPSVSGVRTGSLIITDDANNSPQTIALAGSGASSTVSVSPTNLAFGTQVLSTSSAGQNVTIMNTGVENVTVNSVSASGGYSETDNCAGTPLTPGQTCTIAATFSPVVTGALSGTITINDTAAGSPHIVALSGTGQLPITFSANLTFPATNVGSSSAPQTMTLSNNQSQTLTYTYSTSGDFSAAGNGTSPCNGTLAARGRCTFAITFTPTINGAIKGALTIVPTSGYIRTGGFTGTGQNGSASPLTFTPANLGFGNVALNTPSSKTVTIKNTGSAAITFTSITGSGSYVATPSGASPCTGTLSSGKQCTITVTFTPLVTGTTVGSITVIDNASVSTQLQDASGNGILPVTMLPASISFGTVSVGSTSSVQVVTVTNNFSTATPINSVVASGDFVYTSGGNSPCGASIPAKATCTLGVQFSPVIAGAISGDLTLSFAAGSSPQVVNLSGTGQ